MPSTPWKFSWTPKGLKFWRKRSNIDERTGAAPCFCCFFACQRGWWCTIVDWYPYSVCGKLTKRNLRSKKKMCQSSVRWILTTFNSLENRFYALKCNFVTLFLKKFLPPIPYPPPLGRFAPSPGTSLRLVDLPPSENRDRKINVSNTVGTFGGLDSSSYINNYQSNYDTEKHMLNMSRF